MECHQVPQQLFWCPERQAYVNHFGEEQGLQEQDRLVGAGLLHPSETGSQGATSPVECVVKKAEGEQSYRYDPYSTTNDEENARELERSVSSGDQSSQTGQFSGNSDAGLSDCTTHEVQPTPPVKALNYNNNNGVQLLNGVPVNTVNSPTNVSAPAYHSPSVSGSSNQDPTATPNLSPSQSRVFMPMQQTNMMAENREQVYDAHTPPPPLLESQSTTFARAMQVQQIQSSPSVCSGNTPPQSIQSSPHRGCYPAQQYCSNAHEMQMNNSQYVVATAPQVPVNAPPQQQPSQYAMENSMMQQPVQNQQMYMDYNQQPQMPPQQMMQQPQPQYVPPPPHPIPQDFQRDVKVLVEFKHGRRAVVITDGDVVDLNSLPATGYNLVEGDRGHDICRVICLSSPRIHASKADKGPLPRLMRPATIEEVEYWQTRLGDEEEGARALVNKLIAQAKLPLTVTHASYQIDRKKLTFYYESSEHQPDFRCLLSECYAFWKCRIWFTNLPRRHYKNQTRNNSNASSSSNDARA